MTHSLETLLIFFFFSPRIIMNRCTRSAPCHLYGDMTHSLETLLIFFFFSPRILMNRCTRSAPSATCMETWLIYQRHDSFVSDMSHSSAFITVSVCVCVCVQGDSIISAMTHSLATWLIHSRHDSFIRVMTHSSARVCVCMCVCVCRAARLFVP